ncbi:MAG: RNA polymerase sigma factor [Pseudomonadota bacterium]
MSKDEDNIRSTSQADVLPIAGSAALSELYDCLAEELRAYLTRLLGDGPPHPDDIVQTSFEKLARVADFDKIQSPSAFLWRTAQNTVTSERRALAVRQRHIETVKREYYEEKGAGFDPKRVLLAEVEIAAVLKRIEAMAANKREILLLSRLEGLSNAEIGRRLKVPTSTVRKRLAAALRELDAVVNPTGER